MSEKIRDYVIMECFAESRSILLCRANRLANGESVILKILKQDAITKDERDRFRREFEVTSRLDLPGVVKALAIEEDEEGLAIVFKDTGGQPLDRMLKQAPLSLADSLDLAIGLADTVGLLHKQHIIHKDIKPPNVIVNPMTKQINLAGFGLADELPERGVSPVAPSALEGTLAYISPEQTGRMNRPVDYRTDFYSLGITLYQMLTGKLPFEGDDALQIVYSHIARHPVPPHELNTDIPKVVSRIVMKLMSKMADDRYQTAEGLKADLERCAAQWRDHGRIVSFPLGAHDIPDRLLIPRKLYGREREVESVLAAFDRVVKGGKAELVLVSGYSGIGKSSVVNELHNALVPPRGLFASGKYDQYKRGIPYSTLVQVFETLIHSLLSKSEAELDGWREALKEALEPNGQLIADLVPEIKLIIGEQPAVPELDPSQAKVRFQLVFRRFIGVFARPEHPLALFVDDLQWIGGATLDLVEDLLTQGDVRHLLLIGAYRDNEVGPDHPLMRKLTSIRKAGAAVQEITLAPLALGDVTQLIADTLHCGPKRAAPLAQLVHGKTAGNPFFTIQFLSALAEEGLVAFDHDRGRWSWDLNHIQAKGYTDNVADLMAGKLISLSDKTQKALQQLACLGNVAQTRTLSLVLEFHEEEVHATLQEAVRQEFVMRLDGAYRFVHDRIQEAAYALIPEESRAEAHLRIGRLLLAHMPEEKREEAIFEIVSQLNRGATLIDSRNEREQLAEFNLIAGQRARASTAYASALTYLTAGVALLPQDACERRPDLAFTLQLHLAECEFLTGALAAAEERLKLLSVRATTTLERASITCLQADLYTTLDQSSRAVAIGLDYLRHLGVEWSPHPTDDDVRVAYDRIWSQFGSRAIEDLVRLPLMTDPVSLATMDVLTKVGPVAFFTEPNLYALLACRAVSLSLESGNGDGSSAPYIWLGLIAAERFRDYEAAFRFGEVGYQLVERQGLERFAARTLLLFGAYLMPYAKPVRSGRHLLRRSFEIANRQGDINFAAYSYFNTAENIYASGDSLIEVEREAEEGLEFARKAHFAQVADIITFQLTLVRMLRGTTPNFVSFHEERDFAGPDAGFTECWYWMRALHAHFFAGDYRSALRAAWNAQRHGASGLMFAAADCRFYLALAQAALCESASADERKQHLEAVSSHCSQLEAWARYCPANFENRAALVRAEIARIENRVLDAERLYEKAIASARENGFVQNEAVAYEVAAAFYLQRGYEKFGRTYLTEAAACYARWGALGKVKQLERLHPWLAQVGERQPVALAARLDAVSLAKAQQAISREMKIDKLLNEVMHIVIENAGAQKGFLLLKKDGAWQIVAAGGVDAAEVNIPLPVGIDQSDQVALSVVRFVARTKESVVLDDAANGGDFISDPHIRREKTKSLLCVPLLSRGRLIGIIYLENNLTTHAFTPDRVQLLEMLLAQAAISLENARVYEALRESEERHRVTLRTAMDGFFRTDMQGRILEVNETYCRMSGYSEQELLTMAIANVESGHTAEMIAANLRRFAEEGPERFESLHRRKDGSLFDVEISAQYQPIAGGQLVVFVRDIKERKQAQEAVQNLLAELEVRVEERTKELSDANQLLEAVNKELESFSYSVSHDLRAPLRAIDGFSMMVLKEYAGKLDEEGRRKLNVIRSNTRQMGQLIDDLLAFSRLGRKEMVTTPLDMEALVRSSWKELTLVNPERYLQFSVQRLPPAIGDPTLIKEVVANLLSNAIKFSKYREKAIVEVGAYPEEETNVYFVKDNGVGFDMQYYDKLFGVFQRLHSADEFEGTGVGLAIVERIIHRHGGRVWGKGKEGEGATFYFTLARKE
jgi:PAS domain S-box-containing protein